MKIINNKLKISQRKILCYLVLTLIMNFFFYTNFYIKILRGFLLALMTLYMFLELWNKKRYKSFFRHSSIVLLFIIIQGLSTIYNKQNIITFIGSSLIVILTVTGIEVVEERNMKSFLITVNKFMIFVLILNAFSIIFLPNGFGHAANDFGWNAGIYLLGLSLNQYQLLFLSFGISQILEYKYNSEKMIKGSVFINILYIFISLFALSDKDVTISIILIYFIIFEFLIRFNLFKVEGNSYFISIVMIIVFVGTVITGNLLKNQFAINVITKFLHKSDNISGRTEIWRLALISIKSHPILGSGVGALTVKYTNQVAINAHNQFLNWTIESGVISILIVLLMFVQFFYCTNKLNKMIMIKTGLLILLIGFFLNFLMYAYGLGNCWPFFALLSYVNRQTSDMTKNVMSTFID